MDRLEHLALTDMDARREYARELTRRGDMRGRLLEHSIEPGKDAWLEIHEALESDDAMIGWLSGYLTHWPKFDLNETQVSDLNPLKGLSNLQDLSLWRTQVSDLTPLKGLFNLKWLNLRQTQVSDLSPIQHLIDAGLYVQGP